MTSAYCECHIHYQLIEPEHTMLNITQKDIDTDFIIGDDKKEELYFLKYILHLKVCQKEI